ncbi:Peroxisomal targeting signal 2 receptor [Operophtera brumata]|uniref:Peroxin-7 n=1 Tax=Operophtera brumata TaxID=104452 RepID=A0A0L7LPF3_OPEBR|nr:Peroxisomal targeting signal 2 receptor [Operophtera brumata]
MVYAPYLHHVTWSGTSDNTAACGAGDGAVIVWRVGCSAPLRVLRAHTSEWDPDSETCLSTFAGHSQLVYTAAFSPHSPATFASVSGDGHLKLYI